MNSELTSKPGQALPIPVPAAVNWTRVGWYLALSFGLTWLLDLVLYLNGGLKNPGVGLILQLQMMLPAFSALVLNVFFFQSSPIYFRENRGASRWFIYFYFLLTALYLIGAVISLFQPKLGISLSQSLLIVNALGLILLLVLRWRGGKNTFVEAGMAGGSLRIWFGFGLGLVLFYGLQTWLNYAFKLGTVVDLKAVYPQMAASNLSPQMLILSGFLNAVLIGPFLGLIITFGEEYGWRGFLQPELVRLGRKRGVLLLGVIWGMWHWPVIWMGYNYPGQPLLGSLMMVAYCVILSYFLAYAVFKSKGVWTATYLHALNNQAMSFFMAMLVMPVSMVSSFGIGYPAIILGLLVVLLILRDPLWKENE